MKRSYLFCLATVFAILLCSCASSQPILSPTVTHDAAALLKVDDEIPSSNAGSIELGADENEPDSDELIPEEVVLPILGVKMDGYDNNSFNMTYPRAVAVSEDSVLSITKLSGDLEICWYIDDDVPNCSYRRQDGEWMHFLTENSAYRDGFGAALYNDLFGHSGFYIMCPRGAAYLARDYYYFDGSGELKLLFMGVHLDAVSDFNDDGKTELLWFYHAGRDTIYYYTVGDEIFMFDIIRALEMHFSDWEYICADPLSLRDDIFTDGQAIPESVYSDVLRVNYQYQGIDYYALISFGQNEIIVSTNHTELYEITDNNESQNITTVFPPATPQSPDITCVLSDNTVRFEGVESSFSSLDYYSESRLLFGEYSVMLIEGITSTIEFSEENLTIDNIQMQFEDYFRPIALFIVDMDVTDKTREVLVWEYGTNDWIDNALFSYDGNTVTEVARFIGWAYVDSYGKMILTNNVDGNVTARIADPFITRSYYEFRNGKLEEFSVPTKNKTFTFSDSYAYFNFYETPDAPTEEFANELISSFRNFDEFDVMDYYDKDFAGKRFTILDQSEQEVSYRGAWYFVLLEDGRKGIIHWWLAM